MEGTTVKTSIKGLIQGMTGGEVGIVQGTVKSVSPLKIQVVNDDKLVVTEANTYVPRHLKDYGTQCAIGVGAQGGLNAPTADGSRLTDFNLTGDITVKDALKVGDVVHMLYFNHGKQYYVLDRV